MPVLLFDLFVNLFNKRLTDELKLSIVNDEFVACSAMGSYCIVYLICRSTIYQLININEQLGVVRCDMFFHICSLFVSSNEKLSGYSDYCNAVKSQQFAYLSGLCHQLYQITCILQVMQTSFVFIANILLIVKILSKQKIQTFPNFTE